MELEQEVAALQEALGARQQEVARFETTKEELLGQMNNIKEQIQGGEALEEQERRHREEVERKEEEHREEVERLEEEHREEVDRLEEEQVVEMNLLDSELESLRDEKAALQDRLGRRGREVAGREEVQVTREQEELVARLQEEKAAVVEAVEELGRRLSEERGVREALEGRLGGILDETQYLLPVQVREELEQVGEELRLSLGEGWLSSSSLRTSLPSSTSLPSTTSPPPSDSERTPVHRPTPATMEVVEEQLEVVRREHREELAVVREGHREEMDQLRRYFERVCGEQEARYRQEVEEAMRRGHEEGGRRQVPTPAWTALSQVAHKGTRTFRFFLISSTYQKSRRKGTFCWQYNACPFF